MSAIPDLTRVAPETGAGPSDPFRLLVESWPDVVVIVDERGEPVWKNAAAARLAITTVAHDFRHSPAALAAWSRALEGLPPAEPVIVHFPDGRGVVRILNLRFAPFCEADGQRQIACLLTVRDSAEERLETALEIARSGAWEMHVPSGRVWFSEGYYRLCGADFDLARATPDFWRTRVHPDDYESVMGAFQDYAGGRTQVFEAEYRMRHEDGRWLWLLDRSRTVERDLSGLPVRVIGFLMDITERRAAEQALRAQREELRVQARIIDTIQDGVALVDCAGRILLANPALHSMFHHAPGSLVGREFRELSTLSEAAFDRLFARVHEDLAVTEYSQTEFDGVCADGGRLVAACIFAPMEMRGERCCTLAVLSDITERKRLEREMLLVATREQQRIGSDLHDGLGQQLTGIALLLKGLVARVGRPRHPVSKDDIERIVSLVNEAIDSTRSLARGLSPVPATGDGLALALEGLARQTRRLHDVEVSVEDALPEQLALDDNTATHLYRIAQEAIGNALRHGRPSRIVLTLRAGDGTVELTIADDGVGFDRRALQTPGGLGLKIMRFRARMIGGDVVIDSSPGTGTTIRCHCTAPSVT